MGMEKSGEAIDDQGSGWFEVKKVCLLSFILIFLGIIVAFFQLSLLPVLCQGHVKRKGEKKNKKNSMTCWC